MLISSMKLTPDPVRAPSTQISVAGDRRVWVTSSVYTHVLYIYRVIMTTKRCRIGNLARESL